MIAIIKTVYFDRKTEEGVAKSLKTLLYSNLSLIKLQTLLFEQFIKQNNGEKKYGTTVPIIKMKLSEQE